MSQSVLFLVLGIISAIATVSSFFLKQPRPHKTTSEEGAPIVKMEDRVDTSTLSRRARSSSFI